MMHNWSEWKRFPDPRTGDALEAPIGAGIYEVRHSVSGRVVTLGSASNVARKLSALHIKGSTGSRLAHLLGKRTSVTRSWDLEYRTCAAESGAEARRAAQRLLGLRQTARFGQLRSGFTKLQSF